LLSEYLLVISLEELQEAGLSASGALHSPEAQVISDTLQVLEIHAKIFIKASLLLRTITATPGKGKN